MRARREERRTAAALAAVLGVSVGEVAVQRPGLESAIDVVLSAAGHTFVVEVLNAPSPGVVARHAEQLSKTGLLPRNAVRLLAASFMTPSARRACEAAGVSWFDFSGNAHILAPRLRIIIDGRPDAFPKLGRPATVFAPKSARVVRWLLIHAGEAATQREIARETGLGEGFVSRIVGRLEEEGHVARVGVSGEGNGFGGGYGYGSGSGAGDGLGDGYGHGELDGSGSGDPFFRGAGRRSGQQPRPLRVRDPGLLLDAWREQYRFDKHTIIRGHVAARSGEALTKSVGHVLTSSKVEHAATGLAAAWEITKFAAFRTATFFVEEAPSAKLEAKLGFRAESEGANLWLVVPNDVGVFEDAADHNGVRCVHPVQAYVDLKSHAERAPEAAERLRAKLFKAAKRG